MLNILNEVEAKETLKCLECIFSFGGGECDHIHCCSRLTPGSVDHGGIWGRTLCGVRDLNQDQPQAR